MQSVLISFKFAFVLHGFTENLSPSGSRDVLFLRRPADRGPHVGGLQHTRQPGPESGQGGRELRKRKTQQNHQFITYKI